MRLAKIILALVVMASFPYKAMAQRGYTALTAEYLAATSDLIVRATISDLKIENYIPKDAGEERSAKNFKTVTVLLDATQCLKGATDDSIKLNFIQAVSDESLAKWKDSKAELFWFFRIAGTSKSGIRKILPHDERKLWKTVVEPPDLTAIRPPTMLLDVDFQPLTTEKMVNDKIVRYVKEFGTERTEGTRVPVSAEVAGRSGMHQAANHVLLPSNYKKVRTK